MKKRKAEEQGGAIANQTGNSLERFVESILKEKEYKFVRKDDFEAAKQFDQCIYTKKFRLGQSLFQTSNEVDFIVYHPTKFPNALVIECKWQQSSGTTNQKIVYTVLNIKENYLLDTLLLLDGNGYAGGPIVWVKKQIGGNLKNVFTMVEFHTWANNKNL